MSTTSFYRRLSSVLGQFRLSSTHPTSIILRPYQEQCINACTDALANGSSRIGVSLPTGSGKTSVFITLLSKLEPLDGTATKSIIIVNSVELARQSASQVTRLFPDWSVEIEQGVKHKASGHADVTVATYQTLLNPERLAKFDARNFKAVIIDEAHHAAAPSYRRLLSHFHPDIVHPDPDFMPPIPPRRIPIIGFSATFSRHDGLALGSVFESIVYHQDFLQMIKDEWLCDVRITSVKAFFNLTNVTVSGSTGDFNSTSLAKEINTDAMNQLVVKTWIERAASRTSTLVFGVNVAHVRALTQTFREYGIDARFLYADTPAPERKMLVASFKAQEFPVLVNCAILTEGADIPNIDCVMVARPTRSRNVFAQMIGRGMRRSPETGKENCSIIDFVDSTSRVIGIVSVPTLLGLDPSQLDIKDESLKSLAHRVTTNSATETVDIPNPSHVTFLEHGDLFSFLSSPSKEKMEKLSHNAWVRCGDEVYVLECLDRGHVRVEWVESRAAYVARFHKRHVHVQISTTLKFPPFLPRALEILEVDTLDHALRGCDTYVHKNVLNDFGYNKLDRRATWRSRPASESQKELILKRFRKVIPNAHLAESAIPNDFAGSNSKFDRMKRGEAADFITRMKHGGYGRYKKKIKSVLKTTKVMEQENLRNGRQIVKVGPLRGNSRSIMS